MAKSKVIYWHRLGLKIYEVDRSEINLLRDIGTTDLTEIQEHLSFLRDNDVYLLLSDSISYLFKSLLSDDEIIDDGFRGRLLNIVKSDIPEDFENFSWDYKVIENEGKREVQIFAPIAEVQLKINDLSKKLGIKFVVIEPESISAQRNPNPIVGVVLKDDISGKDEEVLNIVVNQREKNNNSFFKILLIVLGLGLFLGINYFLYIKYGIKKTEVKKIVTENVIVPTTIPTPTVVEIKFESLNIVVQNGTKTAGRAGKIVDKIKSLGGLIVSGENADNTNYTESKVFFKSDEIKNMALEKILTVISVGVSNVLLDKTMENDVKLILGIN